MENEEGKGSAEPRGESSPAEAAFEAEGEEGAFEATIEAEGLEYKGALIRLLAFLIDCIALFTIWGIFTYILAQIIGENPTRAASLFLIFGFIYFIGFWSWRGQTPGKMVIRAKIVKSDGSTIGFGRAFLRFIVYMLYFLAIGFLWDIITLTVLIGLIIFIIVVFNRRKRGLHDMVAGTVVIDTRAIELVDYTDEEEPYESDQVPDASGQT